MVASENLFYLTFAFVYLTFVLQKCHLSYYSKEPSFVLATKIHKSYDSYIFCSSDNQLKLTDMISEALNVTAKVKS